MEHVSLLLKKLTSVTSFIVVTCALVSAVQADQKRYPGSFCKPINGSEISYVDFLYGRINSSKTSSYLVVHCPIVFDEATVSSASIWLSDRNNDDPENDNRNFSCWFVNRDATTGGAYQSNEVATTGYHSDGWPDQYDFSGNFTGAYEYTGGYRYIECWMPYIDDTRKSFISEYVVNE